jgi:hypothetical protein
MLVAAYQTFKQVDGRSDVSTGDEDHSGGVSVNNRSAVA